VNVVSIQTSDDWNSALSTIPNAHVLQTWEWGELKTRVGWTASRLLFLPDGGPAAAAQILRRSLPRTPFGVMYIPKGPALNYQDPSLFGDVLGSIEEYARRHRAIFVKIDPDVVQKTPAAACAPNRGWIESGEQIQYKNTVLLDLTRSEEELFGAMKPKWRYNIRLAQKKGVVIESGRESDLPLFYELYAGTGARDGFLVRRFPYYREVWGTMLHKQLGCMLLARTGSEIIAGLIVFTFSSRAWYFYGASSSQHRDLMPNHLLQWEAIRWAKQKGLREYDFWGAPDRLEESDPMYGVYKFKMGFGGSAVERMPAHDFVVNPLLYRLYNVVRPKYLARLRGRHNVEIGME
jgi:peptidoglycan pentaglycine glycine transferase (the first glycine)